MKTTQHHSLDKTHSQIIDTGEKNLTTIDDKEHETHQKCLKFTKRQEDHALESLQK